MGSGGNSSKRNKAVGSGDNSSKRNKAVGSGDNSNKRNQNTSGAQVASGEKLSKLPKGENIKKNKSKKYAINPTAKAAKAVTK